jgi:iron complex outermembrane receptor protein
MRPSRTCTFVRKIAVLLILAGAAGNAARAQDTTNNSEEQLKQLSLEQLGDLEVTTQSKAPQQVWKTPAAIYVITQEDIKRSGAANIPEALRLAPGVEVARVNASTWSVGIRGFGTDLSRSVLVLMDGRSVYSTFQAGTFWDTQDTVMEDIDRIEVIRGPGGTVWGPNAVNGVINIITKKSQDTQGVLVSAGGGNVEQGFLSARYGGSNTKGLSYRIYGKEFNRSAGFHADGNNYDAWRSGQGGFRLDWTKSPRDSFTLQGDIYDVRAGDNVQLINYSAPFSQVVNGIAALSGGNILGRWTKTFREGEDIQVQAYYDRTNRYEPNVGDLRNTFDVDYVQRFQAGALNHLSWGLGARASQGHELAPTTGLFFTPNRRTDTLYTGFIQDDFSIVPNRLVFELGTKLLRTNYTSLEPEPSLRFLWTPTDTQSVWLAATRAVRTPSDVDENFNLSGFIGVAQDGLPFFARFEANPNFKSEKLYGYELGYRGLMRKNVYLDLAAFYNQYYDLFSEDIIGATFLENAPAPPHHLLPAHFGNGLVGSTTGGEIAPEWRPTSFWRLRGSYSFLHMGLKKGAGSLDVGTAPGIEGSSPEHQVLMQSSFDLPKRVSFDFDYRYVSALPGLAVPDYSTADARLGWTIGHHWELSIAGRNLLQPEHLEHSPVGVKRSFYVKLVWTSKEN